MLSFLFLINTKVYTSILTSSPVKDYTTDLAFIKVPYIDL